MTPSEITQTLQVVLQKCVENNLCFWFTPSAEGITVRNSDNTFSISSYFCKGLIDTVGEHHVPLKDLPARIDTYKKAIA